MDFSPIELGDATAAFWRGVREWCDMHITAEVLEDERATGAGFSRPAHLAMGEQGWIFPTWPVEAGGAGLDPLQAAILELELNAHHLPITTGLSTTRLVAPAIDQWLEGD